MSNARLTDEQLSQWSRQPFNVAIDTFKANAALNAMATEIRERRASDLTLSPDEVDSLLGMYDTVKQQANYWRGKERGDSALEALAAFTRLLRAHGVDPESHVQPLKEAP